MHQARKDSNPNTILILQLKFKQHYTKYKGKKIKCILVQTLRLCTSNTAHRGSRVIALLFLDHSNSRGEESATRPGRSLPPGKTRFRLYRRLGGFQGLSG